jgi:hypothetical protein
MAAAEEMNDTVIYQRISHPARGSLDLLTLGRNDLLDDVVEASKVAAVESHDRLVPGWTNMDASSKARRSLR